VVLGSTNSHAPGHLPYTMAFQTADLCDKYIGSIADVQGKDVFVLPSVFRFVPTFDSNHLSLAFGLELV